MGETPFVIGITRAGALAAAAKLGIVCWQQLETTLKNKLLMVSATITQRLTSGQGMTWDPVRQRWEQVYSSVTVDELFNNQGFVSL